MSAELLPELIKMFAALIFVIGLMGGLSLLLRRFGLSSAPVVSKEERRLRVLESTALDTKRRLVLIQRDDVQHLILLGHTNETLIESGFNAQTSGKKDNSDE